MWKLELSSKNASMKLKRLRRRLEPDALDGAADESPEPALSR